MTSAPENERMDIHVATGLYQAWMAQTGKGEKSALNRLPPEERKAMEEVVKFFLNYQKSLPTQPPEITDSYKALMKRLGVSAKELEKANFSPQRIKDQFFLLMEEAAVKTAGVPPKQLQKALFDEVSKLMYEREKYSALNHPVVRAQLEKLLSSLPTGLAQERILPELKKGFNQAIDESFPADLAKRVARTASILRPLIMRDEKIYSSIAKAESFAVWMKRDGKKVEEAFSRLLKQASKDYQIGQEKHPNQAILNRALELLDGIHSGKWMLSSQEDTAVLRNDWVKKEMEGVLQLGKQKGLNPLQVQQELSRVLASFKTASIEKSGLSSDNLLVWLATGTFLPWFLKFPSLLGFTVREESVQKAAVLREEVSADLAHLLREKNRIGTALHEKLIAHADLAPLRAAYKTFAKQVEETHLKYGEIERRVGQKLRTPFFAGVFAEVLYEHQKFLREQVAYSKALGLFLAQEDEVIRGQEFKTKEALPSRFADHPEVKEIVKQADTLLPRAHFWAEQADQKGSLEGTMTLARECDDQTDWSDRHPLRLQANYEKAMALADRAIKIAENRDLSRFPLLGALSKAFGCQSFQKEGLAKARQLKADICLKAYLADKSGLYLEAVVKALIELRDMKANSANQVTQELKAIEALPTDEDKIGYLFGFRPLELKTDETEVFQVKGLLDEILTIYKKSPQNEAKQLLKLINEGVESANSTFVDLLEERYRLFGGQIALTQNELNALTLIGLSGSDGAKRLLDRLKDRFPSASLFCQNVLSGLSFKTFGEPHDLSRTEMIKILTQLAVTSEKKFIRLVQDLDVKRNSGPDYFKFLKTDDSLLQKAESDVLAELKKEYPHEIIRAEEMIAAVVKTLSGVEQTLLLESGTDEYFKSQRDEKDLKDLLTPYQDQPEALIYLFNRGLEAKDQHLLIAIYQPLFEYFYQKFVEEGGYFSEPELLFLRQVEQLDSHSFGDKNRAIVQDLKTASKAFSQLGEKREVYLDVGPFPSFLISEKDAGPTSLIDLACKKYTKKLYTTLFDNNRLLEGRWDRFKFNLQSNLLNLEIFKDPFRLLAEEPAPIWVKLYQGNEKQIVKALEDYFPEGEKRKQFVQVLTTFDCVIEAYKKTGANEEEVILFLARVIGPSLIQPSNAARTSIPQERAEVYKRIAILVSRLLRARGSIFQAFGGRTFPMS